MNLKLFGTNLSYDVTGGKIWGKTFHEKPCWCCMPSGKNGSWAYILWHFFLTINDFCCIIIYEHGILTSLHVTVQLQAAIGRLHMVTAQHVGAELMALQTRPCQVARQAAGRQQTLLLLAKEWPICSFFWQHSTTFFPYTVSIGCLVVFYLFVFYTLAPTLFGLAPWL